MWRSGAATQETGAGAVEWVRARARRRVYTHKVSRRRPHGQSNYPDSPSEGLSRPAEAPLRAGPEFNPKSDTPPAFRALAGGHRCQPAPRRIAREQLPRGPVRRWIAGSRELVSRGWSLLSAGAAAPGRVAPELLSSLPKARHSLRWANVAILVGLLNSALWVGAWTWFGLLPEPSLIETASALMPLVTQPTTTPPSFPDFPEMETLPLADPFDALGPARDDATGAAHRVTDVPASIESLGKALQAHAATAARKGEVPLVWLDVGDCGGCRRVNATLGSESFADVMRHVSIVRVDAERFESELVHLRFPVRPLSGFVRLSAKGLPLDFVDAREWGNDRSSFAKVMAAFIRGALGHRRHPWRGGLRADEMPI